MDTSTECITSYPGRISTYQTSCYLGQTAFILGIHRHIRVRGSRSRTAGEKEFSSQRIMINRQGGSPTHMARARGSSQTHRTRARAIDNARVAVSDTPYRKHARAGKPDTHTHTVNTLTTRGDTVRGQSTSAASVQSANAARVAAGRARAEKALNRRLRCVAQRHADGGAAQAMRDACMLTRDRADALGWTPPLTHPQTSCPSSHASFPHP